MHHKSLIVAVAAVAMLTAACSSGGSDQGNPRQSGGTPTATPSSSKPSTAPSDSTGTPTGAPAGPPKWTSVLRQPVDGEHLVTQHRKYVVTRSSDSAGTTTVTDRASRRVVVRHRPPAGFVAQSPVVIDDRWALIEEIRDEGPSPQIRVFRYDLASGARQDLAKIPGLPRVSEPEIGASDGTFAYASTDSQGRSCLQVADLAGLKARAVNCVADPGYIADPIVSADSVTFSEITAPGTSARCKRLLTAPLAGGPARPVPAAKKCLQWSGASLRGATAWSEVGADDPDQYQSTAYLRESPTAPARALGSIVTDTIIACGNWIHWEVRTVAGGADQYQIHRWQPGLARPQRVYASAPDTALTAPSCQDSKLLVEAAHLGNGAKYTEALQLDAR